MNSTGSKSWMVFRSTGIILLLLLLGLVWPGCSRKESAEKTATPTAASEPEGSPPGAKRLTSPPQQPPSDGQVDLVALNQLLHKYVMWKKQIPMNMNELVTSGFVSSLPPPPAGKKFIVTRQPFGYEVKLMDQ